MIGYDGAAFGPRCMPSVGIFRGTELLRSDGLAVGLPDTSEVVVGDRCRQII